MSNAVVLAKPNLMSQTPQWTQEQVDLVKRTVCKDSTDDELKLFMHVAQRSGLDPFARQIYAVKRKNARGEYQMTIQVGIDGFRVIADRTGCYAGSDDPVFDDEKKPRKATVTVYKMVQGVRYPFTASARWDEYYPGDSQGFMWKTKPCLMLSKCAESLALRKAFPAELSGLYTTEEMEQADSAGVRPQGPAEGDGFEPDHGYRVSFGKYAKRSLEEIPISDLRNYVEYIEGKAAKDGKPLQGQVLDFVERASAHIAAFENGSQAED